MIKKILKISFVFVLLVILAFVGVKAYNDARYFDNYDATLALNPEIHEETVVQDSKELFGVDRAREYRRTALSIEARDGDRVPALLTQPLEVEGKLPTIIFMHGSGQRKEFVESICTPFNKAGFNMLSYDQWNCGERKIKEGGLTKSLAWYDRGWKAVNDTRRLADYLVTRPDVDPDRLYLVGASYGAMTGTHVLARDKRFKAGVLVVGGGDFKLILDAPIIRQEVPGPVLAALKPITRWFVGPFDPIRSAADTSPTPILMQNGSVDSLVTPEMGESLYAALGEPKEIIWYDVDHPGLRDGDGPEVVRILDEGLEWLEAKAGIAKVDPDTDAVAAASEAETADAAI